MEQDYYEIGSRWDEEIVAGALKSKARAYLVAGIALGLCGLSILAIILLLPLKTYSPYVIAVDQSSGYVEVVKALEQGEITQDRAVTESYLVRYVVGREQYNPAILQQTFEQITKMSRDKALTSYQNLWAADNPDNPSAIYGKEAKIDVRIKSVALLNQNTASVRYMTEKHAAGQRVKAHWNAIISFLYTNKPLKMKERFANPLGFQVRSYHKSPEGLERVP